MRYVDMVKATPQKKTKTGNNENMERRNVNIESSLVDQLKIIAIQRGITLRELCDRMAREEIKKDKKKK